MASDTRFYIACGLSLALSLAVGITPFMHNSAAIADNTAVSSSADNGEAALTSLAACGETPTDRNAADKTLAHCRAAGLDDTLPDQQRQEALKKMMQLAESQNLGLFGVDIERALTALIGYEPENTSFKIVLAQHLAMSNKREQALKLANEMLEKDPDYGPAYLVRAAATLHANDPFATMQDLKDALRLLPDRPEPLMKMGFLLELKFKRPDEALQHYVRALAMPIKPGGMWDQQVYGMTEDPLASIGRSLEASQDSATVVKLVTNLLKDLHPAHYRRVDLLNHRIRAHEKMGNIELVIADLDEALKLSQPQHHGALLIRRGIAKLALKKPAEAQADIERATLDADLNTILRLQVKLRNAGHLQFKINGKFDTATKAALQKCLSESSCGNSLTTPL